MAHGLEMWWLIGWKFGSLLGICGGSLVGNVAAYLQEVVAHWLDMWQATRKMWWLTGWRCGRLLGRSGGSFVGNVATYWRDVVAHWLEMWQATREMWWLIGWKLHIYSNFNHIWYVCMYCTLYSTSKFSVFNNFLTFFVF